MHLSTDSSATVDQDERPPAVEIIIISIQEAFTLFMSSLRTLSFPAMCP